LVLEILKNSCAHIGIIWPRFSPAKHVISFSFTLYTDVIYYSSVQQKSVPAHTGRIIWWFLIWFMLHFCKPVHLMALDIDSNMFHGYKLR
jgi:hypothetical protein